MKPKCWLIVGLPGSGKTQLARDVLAMWGGGVILDDPKFLSEVKGKLEKGWNVVITDPLLCDPQNFKIAFDLIAHYGYDVKVIEFDNDPDQCKRNTLARDGSDERHWTITRLSRIYNPGDDPRPVWRPRENQ